MTRLVQPLKFTVKKNRFSVLKLWVHAMCHNSPLHKEHCINKFYYQKNYNFSFNPYKLKHLKYSHMCSLKWKEV
jgi:hypothetical protein